MSKKIKKKPNNKAIDVTELNDEQKKMCEKIYRMILCGSTLNEIADELGFSKKQMSEEIEPLLISYLSIYIMKNSKVEKIREMIAFFRKDYIKKIPNFYTFLEFDQTKRKFILKIKLLRSKYKNKKNGELYDFKAFDKIRFDETYSLKKDEFFKFLAERSRKAIKKSADENSGKQNVNRIK